MSQFPSDKFFYYGDIPGVPLLTLNMTVFILNQAYADAEDILQRQIPLTEQEAILLHSLLSAHPWMRTRTEIAEAMNLPHRTLLQLERARSHFIPIISALNAKLAPIGLDIAATFEEGYVLRHREE